MNFLDVDWNTRGNKITLLEELADITGIRKETLLHRGDLSTIAVAEKMSWAATRQTTRIEDTAYCLMGIFDVNMPLLYGEEEKAFLRLQEEIIRTTNDLSIFLWSLPPYTTPISSYARDWLCGVLAESPAAFWQRGRISCWKKGSKSNAFQVSNRSIKIKNRVTDWEFKNRVTEWASYLLLTGCSRDFDGWELGIPLRKIGPNEFLRNNPWTVKKVVYSPPKYNIRNCYLSTAFLASSVRTWLLQDFTGQHLCRLVRSCSLITTQRQRVVRVIPAIHSKVLNVFPEPIWDAEDHVLFSHDADGRVFGCIDIVPSGMRHSDPDGTTQRFTIFVYLEPNHSFYETLHYTIIDASKHTAAVKRIQERLQQKNYEYDLNIHNLDEAGIPKTAAAVCRLSDRKSYVVASLKGSLKCFQSHEKCFRCWSLEVSVSDCSDDEIPDFPEESWFDVYSLTQFFHRAVIQ